MPPMWVSPTDGPLASVYASPRALGGMRRPAVAGLFYEAGPEALHRQVAACFTAARGPGAVPGVERVRRGRVRGLVVPHAGYSYSGPIAAHAYAALAADGLPEAVIVLGPQHNGLGPPIATASEAWDTPMGPVRLDLALAEALVAGGVPVDDEAHRREHSIEVQLPFLRFLADQAGRAVSFVPVGMARQDPSAVAGAADAVAGAVEATGEDVVVIASSDLSHVGPAYATPAAGGHVVERVLDLDAPALAAINAFDPDRLLRVVDEEGIPSCGHGPVAAMLHVTRRLGADTVRLLAHGTSHDAEAHDSCVGYAAFVVEGPPRRTSPDA